MVVDPVKYDAWYQTPRGRWISNVEFRLMIRQLQPRPASSLLDVGCGTGHFTRRFAALGLQTTGLDPDLRSIDYARQQGGSISYLEGRAEKLPFADGSFDYCTAVTSLCFVDQLDTAITEMWRVSRKAIVLGLLNRNSLLYQQKYNRGSYLGARWDVYAEISGLIRNLDPTFFSIKADTKHGTAVFLPDGGRLARITECLLPAWFPFGGFLSVCIRKKP